MLLLTVIVKGIFPLEFSSYSQPFNWVPFYGFLTGSMLINVQNLLEKFFLYGSIIWFFPQQYKRLFTVIFVILVTCIEFIQVFLLHHTAEITDPILIMQSTTDFGVGEASVNYIYACLS